MIDPMVFLAFSVYSNPGVYALLLGSGVSRAAGIPTGWEIVLDLIGSVARLQGEEPEPDPDAWYHQKFGEEPEYSRLLEQLAATPSERSALLRSYFEPTDEEREEGLKMPTAGHKAIASLIKSGYIRMILTTNFDRLLQIALDEQGIIPDVISTDDTLKGAVPYVHSKCTIVKLHGDYKDTRIKNTPTELAKYSPALNEYLDAILDQFGVIVCGWSGEWDTALRDAILRCETHRFTTYWTVRGTPTDEAKDLISHRRAQVISIRDADSFFADLSEKLEALAKLGIPHPLSIPMAMERTKKYLSEDRFRIELHDLVTSETESLYETLAAAQFDPYAPQGVHEEYMHRVEQYESLVEILANILITVVWFDSGIHSELITRAIERIANRPVGIDRFHESLRNLLWYPALLLTYAVGICAVSREHYAHLRAALLDAQVELLDRRIPAYVVLHATEVLGQYFKQIAGQRRKTPWSERIYEACRPWFAQHLPEDKKFQRIFDQFEYLLGLTYWHHKGGKWGPPGCFVWRRGFWSEDGAGYEFFRRSLVQGNDWPLLKVGFFGGSIDKFRSSVGEFDTWVRSIAL